jgi:hypothetical protein
MLLSTFFVQPDPSTASLHEIVTHFHLEHGVDAGEGVYRLPLAGSTRQFAEVS